MKKDGAACSQAIFAFHGYNVDQSRFVEKVFGEVIDRAAVGLQIVEAIDDAWTDDDGKQFNAIADVLW